MTKVQRILSDRDFYRYKHKARLYESDDFIDIDDSLTEDNELDITDNEPDDDTLSDEKLKIESLKIATSIGKLLKDITAQDIVTIAGTVSGFIRNYKIEGSNSNMSTSQPTENVETAEFNDVTGDDSTEEEM